MPLGKKVNMNQTDQQRSNVDKTVNVVGPAVEKKDCPIIGRASFGVPNIKEALGDHPKAAIDDQVKSGHRERA